MIRSLTISLLLFTSCGQYRLIGVYEVDPDKNYNYSEILSLKKNKTFDYQSSGTTISDSGKGKWKKRGDTLILNYTTNKSNKLNLEKRYLIYKGELLQLAEDGKNLETYSPALIRKDIVIDLDNR